MSVCAECGDEKTFVSILFAKSEINFKVDQLVFVSDLDNGRHTKKIKNIYI